MIKVDISFEKAVENVKHFTSRDKKGKPNISKAQIGFTCFSNSVRVLQQYRDNHYTVPTKAKEAEEVLKLLEEIY